MAGAASNSKKTRSSGGPRNTRGGPKAGPRPKRRSQNTGRGRKGKSKSKSASGGPPEKATPKLPEHEVVFLEVPKKLYQVAFFDTLSQAKQAKDSLLEMSRSCDQVNIVIKAEGAQYDDDLSQIGKLFVGEAWYLIHQMREAEGWYKDHANAEVS